MTDFIVAIVILLILVPAVVYLVRAKKRGEKCIGCPYAKQCASKNGCGGCGHNDESEA